MDVRLVGEQIRKFRKAAGLTQEELGRSVGVSTQAVSRWEQGGAPDVALLPAIADKLGVTIDALFGREGGTPEDFAAQARRWVTSLPKERQTDELCRMVWNLATAGMDRVFSALDLSYLEHCEYPEMDADGRKRLLLSSIALEDGTVFGVCGEDMSFMSVWPEPEAGWEAYLADDEMYRTLFACLARPGCMEILRFMHGVEWRYYAPEVVARQIGRSPEETAETMEAMAGAGLLHKLELEMESGRTSGYLVHNVTAIVPFLYLARCVGQKGDAYYLNWVVDERPILKKREKKEGKQDEAEG